MEKLYTSAVVKSKEKEEAEDVYEVVVSSGKVDRLGDTIDPKGWYLKNYKENPVVLWSHSAGGYGTPAIPPVGQALKTWVQDGKELRQRQIFATTPFAQELKSLVDGEFLRAQSVGFMLLAEDGEKGNIEIEGKMYKRVLDEELKEYVEKGFVEIAGQKYSRDGRHFTKQELLEVSWVCVPALPNALVAARKMNLSLVTKELEAIQEKEPKKPCEGCKILEARNKELEELLEIKPYPNEHACRLEDPGKYKRFRRENCQRKVDDKCIDVIWGITKDEEEKVEAQALRYDKEVWTEASAKTHCKEEGGSFEPAGEEESLNIKKDLVQSCISKMEEAISILRGLEPKKDIAPLKDKGRQAKSTQQSKEFDAELKVLSMADKALEIIRHKLINKLKEQ